jgi:hypothetical protein
MKALPLCLALAAIAACGTAGFDDPEPQYRRSAFQSERPELEVEPPAGPRVQYLAWSSTEDRALGDWTTLEAAREQGRGYEDRHPQWHWTILFRENTDGRAIVPRY